MADKKITQLTAGTPKSTDLFVAVDTTDTTMAPSGTNKKYTRQQDVNFNILVSALGNYITANENIINCTAPGITITLATADQYVGKRITIKDASFMASSDPITVISQSLATIDGKQEVKITIDGGAWTGEFDGTQWLTVNTQNINPYDANFYKYSTGAAIADAPSISTYKARGNIKSPATVATGDIISTLAAYGYTGSAFTNGGLFQYVVDGTVAADICPMRAELWTSISDGSLFLSQNWLSDTTSTFYGAITSAYRNVTTNAATVHQQVFAIDTSSTAITFSIDTEDLVAGRWWVIGDKSGNAATNNITINCQAGQLINGQVNYVIDSDYGGVFAWTDGSNVFLVGIADTSPIFTNLTLTKYSNTTTEAGAPTITTKKAKGTQASPADITNGTVLFQEDIEGYLTSFTKLGSHIWTGTASPDVACSYQLQTYSTFQDALETTFQVFNDGTLNTPRKMSIGNAIVSVEGLFNDYQCAVINTSNDTDGRVGYICGKDLTGSSFLPDYAAFRVTSGGAIQDGNPIFIAAGYARDTDSNDLLTGYFQLTAQSTVGANSIPCKWELALTQDGGTTPTVTHTWAKDLSQTIAGAVNMTGGDLTVTRSSSGANVAVNVTNTSNTSGSNAALILTNGGSSGGDPKIQLVAVSGNSWSSGLDASDAAQYKEQFNVAVGTSSYRIVNSSGQQTMPLQPAFLATCEAASNVTGSGEAYVFNFNTEIYDQSNNLSGTTFTAPVTGRYFLTFNVEVSQIIAAAYFNRYINTSNRTYHMYGAGVPDVSSAMNVSFGTYADMDAGDTATVSMVIGNNGGTTVDVVAGGTFSGSLIC